jgi:hypothetical protein
VTGVERCLPAWAVTRVEVVLDAWGRLDPDARSDAVEAARRAGEAAAQRVAAELRALFAEPPARQRATPLQIVRGAYREPTSVLAAAGIPGVVRDEFDERSWPDDEYGLVPRTLADLGDDTLGPLLLAWGMAKARALRGD